VVEVVVEEEEMVETQPEVEDDTSSTESIHEDEEKGWQVAGSGKGKPTPKRKKNRGGKKIAAKVPRKATTPDKWGFTVLRRSNQDVMDEAENLKGVLGEDKVLVAQEIGEGYQRPCEDRMLVKTTQLCHRILTERHEADVGLFQPTISEELLIGQFGKEQTPMVEDEPLEEDESKEDDPRVDESQEDGPQVDEPQNQKKKINAYQRMGEISERERGTLGFTIVGAVKHMNMETIRKELNSRREKGVWFHLGEELGQSYPQPAEGKLLLCISEYHYLSLLIALGEGLGGWQPNPTPELLESELGSTGSWKDYEQTDVDGLTGWVAKQDDLG
jgi:hypothetical protein